MNKRITTQRSIVLDTVRGFRSHVTADKVYNTIVKKYPHISRGTVYRNLKLLSDIGEIRKVEMPGGAHLYDYLCGEHYHAKCLKCGKVFDVQMDFIKGLEKSVNDTQGFEFTGHDIIFKGFCLECKND